MPNRLHDPDKSEAADLARRLPLRILVVEDNSVNQKVILLLLAKLGYTADVANDGMEALQTEDRGYQVLLMDIQMPGLDGIEATRRIRAEWRGSRQPWIVAVTASTIPGTRTKCLDAGMNDYLSKPLQLPALAGALERCGLHLDQVPDSESPYRPVGIDPAQLAVLRDLTSNDPEQLSELTDLFSLNTRHMLDNIHQSFKTADMKQLAHQAHSLKGSSSAMGAVRMSQICLEIEDRARSSDPRTIADQITALEREFSQVLHDLQAAIAGD